MTQQLSWEYNMKKLDIVSIFCIDTMALELFFLFYYSKINPVISKI